ncbi:MAG: insulinase family protein [Tissierellia bacterium]|nr:insulinase family protein [Tissierellia bacterium]
MKNLEKYTLIEERYLEEEKADAYVYQHNKTKARIFVMHNTDDNRLFSIGFRTPPSDSTGVCHIIEHSVLNGSKKYRTKEPFMDMVKSSLQTFLNAMTYSDKTIYPVASRNLKDFENLMDLYLDAVFNPRVLEKKEIFLQEGWRYHLEDGKLSYKGVVYNEMKGAMSSAEDQVYSQIYRHLFADTIYAHNSGGDPYEIPKLSYEAFVDYYKNHYHPSNSYIFLYGDLDFERYLDYIDKNYLSNYDYLRPDSDLKKQVPFQEKKHLVDYFSTDKQVDDKSNMISYSIITTSSEKAYDRLMNRLIANVLISSESSPLKEAINKLDIVDDILNASSQANEITWSIIGKNIRQEDAKLFEETVETVLEDLYKNGIDQDLIRSMLNVLVFSLKEKNDNPTKGIEYLDRAFDTWLYDLSPIDGIDLKKTLEYIRDEISNGIFEKYIKDHFLDNPHKLVILHKAKLGLNEKKDREIEDELNSYLEKLSDQEKEMLEKQRKDMQVFQEKEDSPEDKKTIPILELSDINSKFEAIDRQVFKKDTYTILKHDLATSAIDYFNFVFDVNHIGKEDIPYLSILSDFMGLLDTKNYNYKDLFTKTYLETAGISFNLGYHYLEKEQVMNRTLTLSTRAFSDNVGPAMEILSEILVNTKFDNKKRIKDLINMIKSRFEMGLLDYGHVLMMNRALASKFMTNNYMEMVNGIDYYLFYKNLKDEDLDQIIIKLEEIYKKVFNKNNLIVNITSDFSRQEDQDKALEKLISSLNDQAYQKIDYEFKPFTIKEAFVTSTDVSYVSYANNLKDLGYEYKGSATVVSNILSSSYLYTQIRAISGAYGAGMYINNKQAFATYSYRDPNLVKTIETYNGMPKFMDELKLTKEDLKPFIIGAVGKFDPALTEKGKGRRDLELYLSGKDYKDYEDYVKEALESNQDDFDQIKDLLEKALENPSLAVLTSETILKEEGYDFDKIIKLI